MRTSGRLGLVVLLASALALPAVASAAVPASSLIEGVLTSSGGVPAADGNYDLVVSIYTAKDAQAATWSSGKITAAVAGGRFSIAIAVDKVDLAAIPESPWLGIAVGADPELPRQPLNSALFARWAESAAGLSCSGCVGGEQIGNGAVAAAKVGFNYAASSTKGGPALDLACTGCVSVAEMKFDGDVDLGGNSLKGANGTFSGDVTAKTLTATTVTATSFVGDGSKLTGIKTPAGECKADGEVVKGINADGSLKCVAALDPKALPKDGLNEISNDLISNQFIDTINGAGGVKIPDNTGLDAVSNMTFPNIGVAQTFELTVEVENTDLSTVAMTILPPDDKKTGWTLCDPCGKKDEKAFKVTYSPDSGPKSGDIAKWIGMNPQGLWTLKVVDTSFCIPQAPGNSALCDVGSKTDGQIKAWSIKIQTLSNQKIAVNGDTYASGSQYVAKNVDVAGDLVVKGKVDLSATNAAPALTREAGKYIGVVAVRDPSACPSGWNAENAYDLRGSNSYVYMHINNYGLMMADNQSNGYGNEFIYAGFNPNNNGGNKSTICWKEFDAPNGKAFVHFVTPHGQNASVCPNDYEYIPHNMTKGNNDWSYIITNQSGFYLGYVDTWDYACNPHKEDGGCLRRNYRSSEASGACFKVYGVTDDPETQNGVFPVVLGMHGDTKECPAGWNVTDTTSWDHANGYMYNSWSANSAIMGGMYDWWHSQIYRYVNFHNSHVKAICWKMLPRTGGKPSAQVRAPRYISTCPEGFISLSRNNIMGWNNHAYWQLGAEGLYFGGVNSWGHNDNQYGYTAVTFNDTNINKFCLKISNVKM